MDHNEIELESQKSEVLDEEEGVNPADVLRPTGPHFQKGLKYFDLGLKLEILLYEFHSILYCVSLVEITFFVIALICFLKLSG